MRINCLGFAQLRNSKGEYCVLLNRGRFKHNNGERILSPIGGSLQYEPAGRVSLERLGAQGFDSGKDLIFRMPDAQVVNAMAWLRRRRERETSVMREMQEELVLETRTLRRPDLWDAEDQFLHLRRFDSTTTRRVAEKATAYLIETYRVTVDGGAMNRLMAAAQKPPSERHVYFVTREEIMAERTRDGVSIGPITRHILQAE